MAAKNLNKDTSHESSTEFIDDDDDEIIVKKTEEGEGPWLISYADLMTLLMGFFALISSFSSINQQKFEQVKESASEAFGTEYKEPYKELDSAIKEFIEKNNLADRVQIKTNIKGVELTFSGTLFFDSGDFHVKEEAKSLMLRLAEKIKSLPDSYNALIEGHTDSVPISHPIVASNWELSGLRASRIAQLFEQSGFPRPNLTIIGWGDNKPLHPEVDQAGRRSIENMAKNRRVVIYVYDKKISGDPVQR